MRRFFSRLGRWAGARMEEKSTYAGISLFVIALGHTIPDAWMAVIDFWGPAIAAGLVCASEGDKP